jgi:hypothetical protein
MSPDLLSVQPTASSWAVPGICAIASISFDVEELIPGTAEAVTVWLPLARWNTSALSLPPG